MLRKVFAFVTCLGLALAVSACKQKTDKEKVGKDGKRKLTIAVIPKGETHVFWQTVKGGALRAGEEMNVTVKWKGPRTENDRAEQIQVVNGFIDQKVDGICLAPLDYKALLGPVKAANASKIPVVIFYSALDGKAGTDFVSFVATDNKQGGTLGGEALIKILGGKRGKVAMLRYNPGSASTANREAGFLAAIEGKMDVILKDQYAGETVGKAKTSALNLIDTIKKADAIFTPNESSTYGMLLALRSEGLAGKITFIGFDASKPLVEALANGEINALILQDPEKMGYLAVKTMAQYLNKETLDTYIDTGVRVVTKENMNDPEIKKLLP